MGIELMGSGQSWMLVGTWSFHVVLQKTVKKCIKIHNIRAETLWSFCCRRCLNNVSSLRITPSERQKSRNRVYANGAVSVSQAVDVLVRNLFLAGV